MNTESLNSKQGQLAKVALIEPKAMAELKTSLQPLVQHHANRWAEESVRMRPSLDLDRLISELEEAAWSQLPLTLQKYSDDPTYFLGTYFSFLLRQAIQGYLSQKYQLEPFK